MSVGPFQILIIALVILVLFGRGRISAVMGDVGKGVQSFRKGLGDDETPAASPGYVDAPGHDATAVTDGPVGSRPASDGRAG